MAQPVRIGRHDNKSPKQVSHHAAGKKVEATMMNFGKQPRQKLFLLVRSMPHRIHSDSLVRNSMYIMFTVIVTSFLGYLYWILAARMYSTYDVGLASALLSVMTLASTLADLGLGSTLVQRLPHREAGRAWSLTLNAGLITGSLSGLLAGVIGVVALPLFSPQFALVEHAGSYTFAFLAGVPLMIISLLLDQAFVAERAAGNMLIRNLGVAALKIPLLVLPVVLIPQMGALGILLSSVLAMAVMVLGGIFLLVPRLRRAYSLAFRGITAQVRSMLSSLAGNHFINLGGLVPMYLLPVFITVLLSPRENAYFSMVDRLGNIFFMVSTSVAASLFAEGSHTADNLAGKVRSSAIAIGMLLSPAMLICFFGGQYILLLFGPAYAQHGLLLLRISVLSAVPDAITNIYVSVLRVQNRLRFAALLNLGMAALTLSLGWILLPVLGIVGAGWAFLIAQLAGSAIAGGDALRFRYQRRGPGRLGLQEASRCLEMGDQHQQEEEPYSNTLGKAK